MYEDQFVVLDDGKHIIGIDGSDITNLIIENVENQKADKFVLSKSSFNYITTLVYDEKTGFLYSGYRDGYLRKYKIDITSKSYQRVSDFGNLGISRIYSSHRFMDFVFFGGSESEIRVLNLSTGMLFLGSLETSIDWIYSLQVYVKSDKEIYLVVSGEYPDYSGDKTDLFDLNDFLPKDPVILQKYLK